MAAKKRGLGRGLNALLGGSDTVEVMIRPQSEDELREIDVDLIQRGPWQPRTHFDESEIHGLSESIKSVGLIKDLK